jgi:two-component system, chemotaxis family, CheB/CheR fusion protein
MNTINTFADWWLTRTPFQKMREPTNVLNFQLLAESLPQIVWVANAHGAVEYYNRRFKDITGISGLQFSWKYIIHPEDRKKTIRAWSTAVKHGSVYEIEHRIKKTDGTFRWFLSRGIPFKNGKGQVMKWFGTATDIHEQKLSEVRLKELTSQLTSIVEGTSDAIAIKDVFGNYLLANRQTARILGVKAGEIVGKRDRDFFPEATANQIMKNDKKAILSKKSMMFDETLSLGGEMQTYLATKTPLKDEQGKIRGLVVISRDITERKLIEAQKDDFVSIASHELKTPVTSIKAYVQILKRRFRQSDDGKSFQLIKKVEDQVDKVTHLISDLLDVTRLENKSSILQKTTFAYPDLVKEVVHELQTSFEQREYEVRLIKRCRVFADRERLRRVLINLVVNAIKYSPSDKPITIWVSTKAGNVHTSVQDRGLGIQGDKLEKVFERFYRIVSKKRETYSGFGLGLYICKQIVNQHKGHIWVNSVVGKGSTFTFTLPI